MIRYRRIIAPLALISLLSACGAAPQAESPGMSQAHIQGQDSRGPSQAVMGELMPTMPAQAQEELPELAVPAPQAPVPAGGSALNKSAAPAPNSAQSKTAQEGKARSVYILYTGEMGLRVAEGGSAAAIEDIVSEAERLGGFLAGRTNDTVKVKVPSDAFRTVMLAVERHGEVTARSVSAEDVTAEYHDLETRLENLRATRKRIEEFLSRSGSMADMLSVERELERVTQELDRVMGRLRFLKEHTAMSVLTVRLAEKPKTHVEIASPPPPPPPPSRPVLPVAWVNSLGLAPLLNLNVKP